MIGTCLILMDFHSPPCCPLSTVRLSDRPRFVLSDRGLGFAWVRFGSEPESSSNPMGEICLFKRTKRTAYRTPIHTPQTGCVWKGAVRQAEGGRGCICCSWGVGSGRERTTRPTASRGGGSRRCSCERSPFERAMRREGGPRHA